MRVESRWYPCNTLQIGRLKRMECLRVARALLFSTIPLAALAQTPEPIPVETAQTYFSEAHSLCQADHGQLWGVSLCGPIMFVDPQSRSIVASQPDAKGLLKAEFGVFVGLLPTDQNIANTAVEWSGVYWTQMLWPLPGEVRQRETLISHELFHRVQSQLKLPKVEGGENAQLDTVDGRYYLQLEWLALSRALQASTDEERIKAAADAVLFRAERYRLFPGADAQEQALELNEGLAEYTGVRVGNPTREEQIKTALNDLSSHRDDSTFVRSFAYATGPGYGLLLDRYLPGMARSVESGPGLRRPAPERSPHSSSRKTSGSCGKASDPVRRREASRYGDGKGDKTAADRCRLPCKIH